MPRCLLSSFHHSRRSCSRRRTPSAGLIIRASRFCHLPACGGSAAHAGRRQRERVPGMDRGASRASVESLHRLPRCDREGDQGTGDGRRRRCRSPTSSACRPRATSTSTRGPRTRRSTSSTCTRSSRSTSPRTGRLLVQPVNGSSRAGHDGVPGHRCYCSAAIVKLSLIVQPRASNSLRAPGDSRPESQTVRLGALRSSRRAKRAARSDQAP
jgi:hypothetical protein